MTSGPGFVGEGDVQHALDASAVARVLQAGLESLDLDGKRVLVIIPDGTRNAPIPLIYRLLHELIGARVRALDYLIALGTHPPMSEEAIAALLGITAGERAVWTPRSKVFNHEWHLDDALIEIGTLDEPTMAAITDGLVTRSTPIRINRMVDDYDHLMIVGPVFPHEAAGFSGGAKYLFPGIAGPDIIDSIHWMGALATSSVAMGVKDTAVRRMVHRAADFVTAARPVTLVALVMDGKILHGVYVGDHVSAWEAAADLSSELNIVFTGRRFHSVLSMASPMYGDMWTAAKATYKTEPVVEDGGEVIVYAPHVTDISVVHGDLIREVGYHVADYFVKQWDRFSHLPLVILAHSTHVKGLGEFVDGVESPRITVTLATGIPEAECRAVNLGYRDPAGIDPEAWRGGEDDGRLLVEDAGELLYRVARS
jgi:nickel-dependent lactate racemase